MLRTFEGFGEHTVLKTFEGLEKQKKRTYLNFKHTCFILCNTLKTSLKNIFSLKIKKKVKNI